MLELQEQTHTHAQREQCAKPASPSWEQQHMVSPCDHICAPRALSLGHIYICTAPHWVYKTADTDTYTLKGRGSDAKIHQLTLMSAATHPPCAATDSAGHMTTSLTDPRLPRQQNCCLETTKLLFWKPTKWGMQMTKGRELSFPSDGAKYCKIYPVSQVWSGFYSCV